MNTSKLNLNNESQYILTGTLVENSPFYSQTKLYITYQTHIWYDEEKRAWQVVEEMTQEYSWHFEI